ncbi:PREDICTED: uncharacterized protein LOC103328661 [Prunus mume]|uniref:Uncharacterized protein LOC103328661 n=1 Tax=Prunus mume TaxID=102107 RepID=A0ABM0NSS6_PRUMU|nr:PREDICTED: uncharacterized protein LOC103328661 [Prunus mume]
MAELAEIAELPKFFIAFKSVKNQKYLVYHKDQSTPTSPHLLQFSGKDSHSQYARFKVETDVNQPGLVHIKCDYNDKYLRLASEDSLWIVAAADKKQPNKNLGSCTLFKPELVEFRPPYKVYKFIHVYKGSPIGPKSGPGFHDILAAESENPALIVEIVGKHTG